MPEKTLLDKPAVSHAVKGFEKQVGSYGSESALSGFYRTLKIAGFDDQQGAIHVDQDTFGGVAHHHG